MYFRRLAFHQKGDFSPTMDGAILQMCFMQDTSLDKVSTFTQTLRVGRVLSPSWYTFFDGWKTYLSCL